MKLSVFIFLFVSTSIFSCTKLAEVDPPITSTNGDNVFDEDGTAIAALTGIYTNMSNSFVGTGQGWLTNIFFTTGLTGDELELWNKGNAYYDQYYSNSISTEESTWYNIYKIIFTVNSAIEKLPTGSSLTPATRNQLLGEAKFMRAMSYFYLVNLYGGVPLAVSSDYKVNQLLPRADVDVIYNRIIEDLSDAESLLSESFLSNDMVTPTEERVRPTKWAALALLSRVYLYTHDYSKAIETSTRVIENTGIFNIQELNNVFIKNNGEAIWQLMPVGTDDNSNTKEGSLLKLFSDVGPSDDYPVYLTESLVNSFDERDMRKQQWVNFVDIGDARYYFAYKYKIGREITATNEYSTVLRLAELYLIRAEAQIMVGNIAEGIKDINILRSRATDLTADPASQLPAYSESISQENAIAAIEQERQHELFTEWGHRWFDLKRTNRSQEVLGYKPNWESTDVLFPLPGNDLSMNPNLRGRQNPGYN